jgi:hypothetical protein
MATVVNMIAIQTPRTDCAGEWRLIPMDPVKAGVSNAAAYMKRVRNCRSIFLIGLTFPVDGD